MKNKTSQSPRIFQIEGKSFQYDPKTRGAFNVANPTEKLSRRKLDTALGKLQKQGFSSYEEKAKSRKQAGITKDIKAKVTVGGKIWYEKKVYTLDEVYDFIKTLNSNQSAYFLMRGIYNNQTRITGAKKELRWFGLSANSRPSVLLNKKEKRKIEIKVYNLTDVLGVIPSYYEVRFTSFPPKN